MIEIRAFRPREEPTIGRVGQLQAWTADGVHVVTALREPGTYLDKRIYAINASQPHHAQDALRAAAYFINRGYTVA